MEHIHEIIVMPIMMRILTSIHKDLEIVEAKAMSMCVYVGKGSNMKYINHL